MPAGAGTRSRSPRSKSGLAFASRGHTAGETMLAGQLVLASERAMIERLALLPRDREEPFPLLPRLTGLIVFRS